MIQRFAYLDTIEKLNDGVFLAAFNYALEIAKSESEDLTIVVNNVKACSNFVEKFMDKVSLNKLIKGELLTYQGVNIFLKSPFSLKNYQRYGVMCAFHPSSQTLSTMEGTREPSAIIVLGEFEEPLNIWVRNNEATLLAQT
jgi:hypothetical protein